MKTQEQLKDRVEITIQQWHDWAQTHLPSDNKRELATRIIHLIAEIQRDAREGMVPVDDFRSLVEAIRSVATGENQVANDDTEALAWITKRIDALRAKHPNLFTK